MNTLLSDFIDAEIAAIVPEVTTPVDATGFGTDLDCLTDLTETASSTSDPTTLLTQWVIHTLSTTEGMLPGDSAEEKSHGVNVLDMIGQDAGDKNARQWELLIQQKLLRNEQIAEVQATVTQSGPLEAQTFDVDLSIAPANPNVQPFRLVLGLSPLGVFLKTLEAQS